MKSGSPEGEASHGTFAGFISETAERISMKFGISYNYKLSFGTM
jgi:hypothetical protein